MSAMRAGQVTPACAVADGFSAYNISVFAICLGEHQSISGEATVPPGDETSEWTRAAHLTLQHAVAPTATHPTVYRPIEDLKPSSPE